MEKVNYYVRGLKPSFFEDMLEELKCMFLNVCGNLIGIRLNGAANGRSLPVWMEDAQPRESMNTKTSWKRLYTFMLGYTPDVLYTRSNLPSEQGPESHLYPLNTVEVVRKLL